MIEDEKKGRIRLLEPRGRKKRGNILWLDSLVAAQKVYFLPTAKNLRSKRRIRIPFALSEPFAYDTKALREGQYYFKTSTASRK